MRKIFFILFVVPFFFACEKDEEPVKYKISAEAVSVKVGEHFLVKPTITPAIEVSDLVFESLNPKVFTVNSKGEVQGKLVSLGYLLISSKQLNAHAYVYVFVKPVMPTALTLDKQRLEIEKGKTATLKATISPANTTNKEIIWKTSDDNIATVENGSITAINEGECDIMATIDEIETVCKIKVIPNL